MAAPPLPAQIAGSHTTAAGEKNNAQRQIPEGKWEQYTEGREYKYARERELINRQIPDKKWNRYTADKEYGYAREKEAFKTNRGISSGNELQFLKKIFAFLSGGFGVFLLWSVIAIAAVYITYMVLQHNRQGKKNNHDTAGNNGELPEDIAFFNWAELLRKAMAEGNERQVVRCSFMLVLQLLSNKELIAYRKDKTNYDYYRELAAHPMARDFRHLSNQYEYVWYGEFKLPAGLENYMAIFNKMRDQLK